METIEPVSTRHGTLTRPTLTSKWEQEETSFDTANLPCAAFEPVEAPSKLWLCSLVGASFPDLGRILAA